MAVDISNGISLKVSDGISASISSKLDAIATNSVAAAGAINNLQAAIDKVNASSVSQLATNMRTAATAANDLAARSIRISTSFSNATQASANFTRALSAIGAAASILDSRLQALVATTNAYGTAVRSVVTASAAVTSVQNAQARATSGASGSTRGLSAGLSALEGRATGANYAAARFIATLGITPGVMAAAFSVVGALALVGVIVQVAEAIGKVVEAYHNLSLASRQASDQAILDGDKIIKSQASIATATNFAKVLSGDFQGLKQPDINVQNVSTLIEQTNAEKQIAAARASANQAGLQGAAQQRQRVVDIQSEITANKAAAKSYSEKAQEIKAQLEATHTYTVRPGFNANSLFDGHESALPTVQRQGLNITDPNQVKDLQTQLRAASEEARRLNTETSVLGYNLQAAGKKEGLAQIKDDAKAAREQMRQINAEYERYRASLSKPITPQQTLSFYQGKENDPKTYQQNKDPIEAKVANASQQIAQQNQAVADLQNKLSDEVGVIGTYSNAQKIAIDLGKDFLELEKAKVPITDSLRRSTTALVTAIVTNAQYQQELNKIYTEFDGPAKALQASLKASETLLADGVITGEQFARSINAAGQAYNNAVNPLAAFNKELENNQRLANTRGTASEEAIDQQVNQLQNQLRGKVGNGSDVDAAKAANAQRPQLEALQQQQQAQKAYNEILQQQIGVMQQLQAAQTALTQARKNGLITEEQYQRQMSVNYAAQVKQREETGQQVSAQDMLRAALAAYVSEVPIAAQVQQTLNKGFETLANGAADSLGRAIVYGENLNKALKQVAQEALQQIISGLIKVAIQELIVNTLMKAIFGGFAGGGAVPGFARGGLIPGYATGGAIPGFATGSVSGTGTGTSDSILARLSNGEFVVNAKATSQHLDTLTAINSGKMSTADVARMASAVSTGSSQASTAGASSGTPQGLTLHLYDQSTGKKQYNTSTDSNGNTRLMIRDEIQKQTPQLVANEIRNPNSVTSRALSDSTTAGRKR